MPARGMHDQAGSFVDDQQMLVLVGDREGRRVGWGRRVGQGVSLRGASKTKNSSSTPRVIEVSARLKGGQPRGSLMKSVTPPPLRRSRILPSAPPISMPVGSQIKGRVAWSAK